MTLFLHALPMILALLLAVFCLGMADGWLQDLAGRFANYVRRMWARTKARRIERHNSHLTLEAVRAVRVLRTSETYSDGKIIRLYEGDLYAPLPAFNAPFRGRVVVWGC